MKPIDTQGAAWRRAKKTKGIRAKPMVTLLVDRTVVNKFLLDTLEGREPLGADAVFCIGDAGDAWQQSAKALLKKYDVKGIDADGWMLCEPKPENEVEFFIAETDGLIKGQWGETIDGVEGLQHLVTGDAVVRQPHDHTDQWVVRRSLFNGTYSVLGE